ncbi:transglycosylase domain-containing protein [Turneriella parva]|uniref:Glycosyl transferase family 51 n=1 Tax=Turneriella parva (strain ATCC BAA-1111 / DSM 21527 / NCTC 11395 / H) TaxID=869212 RepID=I4B1V6_TURPD|nr:transglycosylase domain-containing protein [Turneriella parva]AFM11263.1 glycosyl transferase family 51 [Turneriella parva DSM 21527]
MKNRLRRYALISLAIGSALVVTIFLLLWHQTSADLAFLISAVQHPPQTGEITYLDAAGVAFDHEKSGTSYRSVELEEIDTELIADLVAVEDRNFASHRGADFWRTMRAAFSYVVGAGSKASGGSTLTQQLIKNLLNHRERTPAQKAKEILLALRLENALVAAVPTGGGLSVGKRQILSAYFNHLFVANRYRGLKNFAELVLRKNVARLTAGERVAVLAVLRSPAAFMGPEVRLTETLRRIESALGRAGRNAANTKLTSAAEAARWLQNYTKLITGPVYLAEAKQPQSSLAKSIGNLFNLSTARREYSFTSTKVATQRIGALDEILQQRLENRLVKLNRAPAEKCSVTGAYLLVRLTDASVEAAGEDRCSQFNELVQAKRQVSSTIKPFLYAYAFETLQLTPASIFDDRRVTVAARDGSSYAPANHYKTFRGKMHLKNALQVSANTISLQLFDKVNKAGFSERMARAFARYPQDEVAPLLHRDYSLALGTVDLSPVHVASAYLALLSRGRKVYPHWGSLVSGIDPHQEMSLPVRANPEIIFDPLRAEQVREMLTAVLRPEGTGGEFMGARDEIVIQELGAKSGSGPVDTWFVGYSQDVLLLVWLGFRERSERPRDFHAATLWYDLYLATLPWFRPKPMVYAPELEKRYFCAETGLPPTPACRRIASALFRRDPARW